MLVTAVEPKSVFTRGPHLLNDCWWLERIKTSTDQFPARQKLQFMADFQSLSSMKNTMNVPQVWKALAVRDLFYCIPKRAWDKGHVTPIQRVKIAYSFLRSLVADVISPVPADRS